MEDQELTQEQKHRLEASGVNTSPELVAVVQYDEGRKETVCLLNNQILKHGDEVDYRGKKFLVGVQVENPGTVPDEVDHSKIDHVVSSEAWDKKELTNVTTSATFYGTKPGRTVTGAVVSLVIGGARIEQSKDDAGKGSLVVCKPDKEGGEPVILRRWRFVVPWTVFGFKAAPKPGKKPADE
jgi:hypothetical protein